MAKLPIYVKCPDCDGIGEYQDRNGVVIKTCNRCGGDGGILVDEKDVHKYQ